MYNPNLPPPVPGMMQAMGAPAGTVPAAAPAAPGFMPQTPFMPTQGLAGMDRGGLGGLGMRGWAAGIGPEYISQLKAWLGQRPSDRAGFDAWRAAMPSPFGGAQAPAAQPLPPGQTPYPVTQLPNQQPVTQIAPVPPQAPVTAPPFPAPPASGPIMAPGQMPQQGGIGGGYAPGNYAPRQGNPGWAPNISRPVSNPGGGFFGSRRGR